MIGRCRVLFDNLILSLGAIGTARAVVQTISQAMHMATRKAGKARSKKTSKWLSDKLQTSKAYLSARIDIQHKNEHSKYKG